MSGKWKREWIARRIEKAKNRRQIAVFRGLSSKAIEFSVAVRYTAEQFGKLARLFGKVPAELMSGGNENYASARVADPNHSDFDQEGS